MFFLLPAPSLPGTWNCLLNDYALGAGNNMQTGCGFLGNGMMGLDEK
jgi:hypothetical protein